jgi:hypothetical protein
VREYLDEHGDNSDDGMVEEDPYRDSSPALLLGTGRPLSKEELLVDIPPRSTADRLVSRFLKTSEPSLVVIHVPTFQKEYEQFWTHPQGMSFTWIALLYSIMTLSVSLYHRSDEPLPLNTIDSMTAWNIFRKRAAQCLAQANYLTPGQYKAETLFLYSLCEFYRSQDAQTGVSYLLGITIRLAMRMGYHRDPSHCASSTPWSHSRSDCHGLSSPGTPILGCRLIFSIRISMRTRLDYRRVDPSRNEQLPHTQLPKPAS